MTTNNQAQTQAHGRTTAEQTTSRSEPWQIIQDRADSAVEGLQQAGLNHANAAIARHAEALSYNSEAIAETLQLLMDPRTAVALAEIKAADYVNDRLGKCEPRARAISYQKVRIPLPQPPSFSQFYSLHQSEQQHALSGVPTEPLSEESRSVDLPPISNNGKAPQPSGKGLAK